MSIRGGPLLRIGILTNKLKNLALRILYSLSLLGFGILTTMVGTTCLCYHMTSTHFDVLNSDVASEYLDLPFQSETPRGFIKTTGMEPFSDITKLAQLDKALYSMGSNFGDLDNDGWLDFYVGTGSPDLRSIVPNRAFRNVEGNYFEDITYDIGMGHIQKGHSIAFADLDRDGDQDVYAVMGGAVEGDIFANALFENPAKKDENAWITIELEGRTANRSAIGARIEIIVRQIDGQNRKIMHGQ